MKFKRQAVKKEDLIKYCKQHSIYIPNERTVSMEYLYSAIHRALMHGKKPEITTGSCFGYWEKDDMNCETCDYSDDCFKSSVGEEKDKYEKKFAKEEDKVLNLDTKDLRE